MDICAPCTSPLRRAVTTSEVSGDGLPTINFHQHQQHHVEGSEGIAANPGLTVKTYRDRAVKRLGIRYRHELFERATLMP